MKIFDCFLFFNELDLLEIRIKLLYNYVDYFVIVESAQTFQGDSKEFIYEKNKTRFKQYEDKIIHYKIDKYNLNFADLQYIDSPKSLDDEILNRIYKFIEDCPHFDKKNEFWWGNDFFQRENIWRALAIANPSVEDLIFISDVDEIPNPEIIFEIKKSVSCNKIVCLRQHEFCYFLNYYHNSDWLGTCCFIYGNFLDKSLNSIRFSSKRNEGFTPIILEGGGWHFTSLGGVEAIKLKINSWGHKEFNNNIFLKGVEYNVRHGYDIFRRPGFGNLEYLHLEDIRLPASFIKLSDKYQNLIGPVISRENFLFKHFNKFYFRLISFLHRTFN